MKRFSQLLLFLTLILSTALGTAYGKSLAVAAEEGNDRTLSPYFFVKSDDPSLDWLPLKSTKANVNIIGVIADVKVTQTYENEGKRPIEAIYVFPASTRAAVYGMKMTIGKRVIEARIEKREDARKHYEQARDQGKSASLLEQQRPNVFQMNVANIMPGDEIKVEMLYTELLVLNNKVYEFVYPTVVGPRYTNKSASSVPASEQWTKNPYLHEGEAAPYAFDISVNVSSGLPIRDLDCPSHKVTVLYNGPARATVNLEDSGKQSGNRDYILRYRLAGDRIESGLLLHKGEKENFFLLMVQPPNRVTHAHIPPREYIFIVDVSGSMHGFPLDISKTLLKDLIGNLRATDRFNVLLFSGGNSVMSEESVLATTGNIDRAIALIERQQGGGGTELLPALKRAISLKRSEGYSRTIVIATDGYVAVEEEVFDLMRKNLGDANMFAFGIGSSVNRHIIEGMAHVGMGEPFVITKQGEASAKAESFRKMIESPVLTGVKVDFGSFKAYDVEPLALPDVLSERPIMVFGKWRGKVQGHITITGLSGNKQHAEVIDVSKTKPSDANAALRYLWARHRITLLSDYNMLRLDDSRIKKVAELGVRYNLLTAYTSFVAIDSEARNTDGKATTVKQPLPLPQGVSDLAVGGMPTTVSGAVMRKSALPAPGKPGQYALHEQESKDERGKQTSTVSIGDISVSGGLDRESVVAVVRQKLNEIERCNTEGKKGKVTFTLVISADGMVHAVKVHADHSLQKTIEQCMIKEIRKWQFPASSQKKRTEATITLLIGS